MNALICDAIRKREKIRCYYKGGYRTLEPHCHGTSRAGNESLRAYQIEGYSSSGNPVDWKFLTVAKMSEIESTGETFSDNRQDYNPDDQHMSTICCRV